ncbi:hypothetical protein [Salinimicrobium gaetbulicola]|uniref:Uncharacterized protein n=1 Tax=Salinimicrobium gaetbulicola TaxID=999702 RepID=A0ABW3ICC9_9FLAO
MEFFKILDLKTSEEGIQTHLTLENLDTYSSDLFPLQSSESDRVQIGGIWGEFTLLYQTIAGGVRFALKECPNALAWTVTTGLPPEKDKVVIHLTVNRKEREPEFLEEIQDFMEDLSEGLLKTFSKYETTVTS